MPFLDRNLLPRPRDRAVAAGEAADTPRTSTFADRFHRHCASPACSAQRAFVLPWIHRGRRQETNLSQKRAVHCFAGEAVCSRVCLGVLVSAALRRELAGEIAAFPLLQTDASPYRHRIPLGLLMLSRQRISRQQLTRALEHQKRAGQGRIGEWLIRTEGVQEEVVAQALAAQWGVPMLTLGSNMGKQLGNHSEVTTAHLLPRFFVEAFGTVPVRVAAGRILYLAVDAQVDGCLNAAIAAMTGYKVEPCVMTGSDFHSLRRTVLGQTPAAVKIFNAASIEGLANSIVELILDSGAANSRLVRAREYIWVRTESASAPGNTTGVTAGVEHKDAIFTLPRHAVSSVAVMAGTTAFDGPSSPTLS